MKTIIFIILSFIGINECLANEGSWFGPSIGYEHLSNGATMDGFSAGAEGGYWYLGNQAYGGSFKANFFSNSSFKVYDLGGFWKAGGDSGVFGKLLAGLDFISKNGFRDATNISSGKSFYIGLGGGFLRPISENFKLGTELAYKHLTTGNGADQISIQLVGLGSF